MENVILFIEGAGCLSVLGWVLMPMVESLRKNKWVIEVLAGDIE